MGWTPADLPDLHGRRAIVTGANSGIGYHTALELARHGAEVTLACRRAGRAAAARDRMCREVPDADVRVAELDLSRLDSVRTFATAWAGPLNLLVNNAGVYAPMRRAVTADGFERQMGTNHLGHFALTGRLLPAMLATPAPRVVTVASLAHHGASLDRDDLQSLAGYGPQRSYGKSKLANLLFALELQRRAAAVGSALTSTAAHPGLASTALTTNRDGLGGFLPLRLMAPLVVRVISQSAAAGAVPTLYAAIEAAPGTYTGPQSLRQTRGAPGPATMSRAARDRELASQLWRLSEELTGVGFEWPPARH